MSTKRTPALLQTGKLSSGRRPQRKRTKPENNMRTEQIQIFKYDELSDAAKAKAREWWRESSRHDDFWSEWEINEARELGGSMGLEIENVYFSGFWSQGNGACFDGRWKAANIKAELVADGWSESPATSQIKRIAAEFAEFAKAWPESSFTVKHSGRYSHENCTYFTVSLGEDEDSAADSGDKAAFERWSKAEREITETAKSYMRWIYRQLEAAYSDYYSDTQVEESILANNYEFTADGKIH